MSPRLKEKILSDKKDVNYSRAVPLVPAQCSRREMRILSSTVSKAAVRSKNIRVVESLESAASIRSLKTFKSADLVL